MCGLAGFLRAQPSMAADCLEDIAAKMANALYYRGPDDGGVWSDPPRGYAVGHRRLSIIDLSAAGHQPMLSSRGRYVLSYNGEIYNFDDLRRDLEAAGAPFEWKGHSDTEVLLAGVERWGLADTLRRAAGMFALALWDRETGTLQLARDRMGEKPLYYGWQGEGEERAFLFSSEVKGLKQHPAFDGEIDRAALTLYLRHNYVPTPYSIFKGIAKLRPGTILTVRAGSEKVDEEPFWDLFAVARRGQADQFKGSPDDAVDELSTIATRAVRRQMVSDVPLGAFLSGGIDSSTVVSLMQALSGTPVRTFTIGYNESGYDEAKHAHAVARHLGTEHHELYVEPATIQSVIPRLPEIYCEPFADSSQIPTFLVSQLARQHVTVSLSGDGGDELFAGYNRYTTTQRLWSAISRTPMPLRRVASTAVTAIPPGALNRLGSILTRGKQGLAGDKLHKGAGVVDSDSIAELFLRLTSHELEPDNWVRGGAEPATLLRGARPDLSGLDDVSQMMALDGVTYLPDDILVKVDRAAMAVSLESRVPFLDHEVVAFAWTLPLHYKLRDGVTKWPLRQLLYRHVPRQLVDRPKQGFAIPVGEWLCGPLRDWAEILLDADKLEREGYWNTAVVRRAWADHLSGRRTFTVKLWSVLMFQAWLDTQLVRGAS
jgi:asparagine synthase (glutamine-hydrolysing)